MICKRYFVSGRVQGVFYRSSTMQQAKQLGLHGWVRNLSDGRVETLACGEIDKLDDFEKWLEIGPQFAKVTNIIGIDETVDACDNEHSGNFEIRPTV